MKKLFSLIRATMTSDMNLFKINSKKSNKKTKIILPLFIGLYLMFMVWSEINILFEKMTPLHLQSVVLALLIFGISMMTIMEGIYKTGSLIFNCKDDQLLLSLPIKRRTVLFIRFFKFYVFELMFNSIFLIPLIISYIRWADSISWTYYLTSIVMILMLPIIPIVISCVFGALISSLSSRLKYKNLTQIVLSMGIILIIIYLSFNLEGIYRYIIKNATSINDLITKIYYPAGVYTKLVSNFDIIDFIKFILINITIFILSIFVLSKFYFKINSRLKSVQISKKINIDKLKIKKESIYYSLIKKEFITFFKTPVFIINAGFGLVLFIVISIVFVLKFDVLYPILTDKNTFNISKSIINSNISLIIFMLISFTAYMTSITSSVISLEGKNINIIKSLPVNYKKVLMSKIYSSLLITTPVLLIGDLILFIKFKLSIIEIILLLLLSILIPLVSHFVGIIINLKYPKLDFESSTEVVKQSASSFIAVMIGLVLLVITVIILTNIIGKYSAIIVLLSATIIYVIINIILYLYLIKISVKEFRSLTV